MKLTVATLIALALFKSGIAAAESEFKYIFTPATHAEFNKVLESRGFKRKSKVLENHYLDMGNFLFLHNDMSIRVRIINGNEAELTIKDGNRFVPQPFRLDELNAQELREKDEYECVFKSLVLARWVLQRPSRVLDIVTDDCETVESSHIAMSPVDFLTYRVFGDMFLPFHGYTIEAEYEPNRLKVMATATTIRHAFKVTYAGHELDFEVDETRFADGSMRYGADLDVTKITDEETREQIRQEVAADIRAAGQEPKPSLAGKTPTAFLISVDSPEVAKLRERGELHRRR